MFSQIYMGIAYYLSRGLQDSPKRLAQMRLPEIPFLSGERECIDKYI